MLDRRLDARVDDMMSRGLVTELAQFHHLYNTRRIQDQKYTNNVGNFRHFLCALISCLSFFGEIFSFPSSLLEPN